MDANARAEAISAHGRSHAAARHGEGIGMNTLYYSPGNCALGIHLLLEEVGKPYELSRVDFANRAQYKPEYLAINPKSKVPALRRDDGSVLTEFPAIAYWLAVTNPEKKLFPTDPEGQARALETLDYVVATLHMQGFTRIWRPANFAPDAAEQEAVKAKGREICEKGLAILDRMLEGKNYVVGDFSIADAALFYFEFWLVTRAAMSLPKNCDAHYRRVLDRPATRKALAMEALKA
jgi:glutathione S-transferase